MGDTERLRRAASVVGVFAATLWVIRISEAVLDVHLGVLGVRPGQPSGLVGVVTAPLVHGSFRHLLTNTPPLLFLGTLMLYGFPRGSIRALPLIWLGSGLGVWLFAREASHIGVSGVNIGMLIFVFVAGVLRRDRPSIAMAMAVAFLYGGMIWGVLPLEPRISFESHLAGAACGLLAAVLFKRSDPLPPRRRYEWEEDPSSAEQDPLIGDLWRHASAPEKPLPPVDGENERREGVASSMNGYMDEENAGAHKHDDQARQSSGWKRDLRPYLERLAADGRTVTYREAALALDVEPPHRIHKLAEALEATMDEDVAADRPLRAAVIVSKTGTGLPQRGFFIKARELGRYDGPDEGERANRFHAEELQALRRALQEAD